MKSFSQAMVIAGFVLLGSMAGAHEPPRTAVKLDIAAQPISDALNEFARQAGLQVFFLASEDSKRMVSTALAGTFPPQQALARLLSNTGLNYEYLDARTIAIRSRKAGNTSSSSLWRDGRDGLSTQMRLALVAEGSTDAESDSKNKAKRESDEQAEVVVEDSRIKPLTGANVDLPRGRDDAQPYYIFDSKKIELSGATSVEDFLTRNLTMNVLRSTNTGNTTSYGTNSDVNLRGLGSDNTLILVNGRRVPNAVVLSGNYQPDVNGISPAMIDRIEVLPSSASGIYGANALAGVVNIVLKSNYTGGDVRANYSNTLDSDAARRSIALNYGWSLEGGKTQLQISAQYSDGNSMRLQDRADLIRDNYARVFSNNSARVYSISSPFAGATTNISNTVDANLELDSGGMLDSRITYVSPGTAPGTSAAALDAMLAANAGAYNLDLPSLYWLQTGLGSYFGFTPTSRSASASLTRKLLPNLEAFVEYSYRRNRGESLYSGYFNSSRRVGADASTNPFTTDVVVTMPAQYLKPRIGTFDTGTATVGLKATLPHGWLAQLDYAHSKSDSDHIFQATDNGGINADMLDGAINPFVDTQLYPVSIDPYGAAYAITHGSTQNDLALRGFGPLPSLPWGVPHLTFGLENRMLGTVNGNYETITPSSHSRTVYFGRKQVNTSLYMELQAPLLRRDSLPLVHTLDLQLAGRADRYTVTTGTPTANTNVLTGTTTYGSPNINGEPYTDRQRFESVNPTIAIKYQPVESLTLRASYATAFQPPTASQLQRNPEPSTSLTTIDDPETSTTYDV